MIPSNTIYGGTTLTRYIMPTNLSDTTSKFFLAPGMQGYTPQALQASFSLSPGMSGAIENSLYGLSDVGSNLSSNASRIKEQQDSLLSDAQSLGSASSNIAGATRAGGVFGWFTGQSQLSVTTGQAQQEQVSKLLDTWLDLHNQISSQENSGNISHEEASWLTQRNNRIKTVISTNGAASWQESEPFRSTVTTVGGYTSAVGLTTPQGGGDIAAMNKAKQNINTGLNIMYIVGAVAVGVVGLSYLSSYVAAKRAVRSIV